MITSIHKCDLCEKEYGKVNQWHDGSIKSDGTKNYSYSDIVHFPKGWEKVGVHIICETCLANICKIEKKGGK